jgi:hypothetical protein
LDAVNVVAADMLSLLSAISACWLLVPALQVLLLLQAAAVD